MNAGAHQKSGDGFAEAADDSVVLGDDDQATGLAGLAEDRFGIQRFDRGNMQHSDVDLVVAPALGPPPVHASSGGPKR